MEKSGYLEIRITGSKGNLELIPENYDVREIMAILENIEDLLYPNNKKDRPIISYSLEEGSVKHIFKTSIQYIIAFNAIIGQIGEVNNIEFLDLNTAKAFENIQEIASKTNYTLSLKTSLKNSNEVKIDRTTNFKREESVWAEAEFYFYGKITNAGGKEKANIHIYTEDLGTIRVHTPISFLEKYEDNLLYKTLGIRVTGKQNSETGEIDTTSLNFVELVDFDSVYNENYLKKLREKAKNSWLGKIDADEWLTQIRGGYEA